MHIFDKEPSESTCHGLCIESKKLSWLLAACTLMSFFIFMAGYFWGYQKASSYFTDKLQEGSFGDQVCSSMYALYDRGDAESTADDNNDDEESGSDEVLAESGKSDADALNKEKESDKAADAHAKKVPVDGKSYYAQLVGFGSHSAATKFAEKLQKKGVAAQVSTRHSKTARGKNIAWYQVVTANYSSRDELVSLTKKLEKEHSLTDIRIITC